MKHEIYLMDLVLMIRLYIFKGKKKEKESKEEIFSLDIFSVIFFQVI